MLRENGFIIRNRFCILMRWASAQHFFGVLKAIFELFEKRHHVHAVGECMVDAEGNGQHVKPFSFAGSADERSRNQHMLVDGSHLEVVERIGDLRDQEAWMPIGKHVLAFSISNAVDGRRDSLIACFEGGVEVHEGVYRDAFGVHNRKTDVKFTKQNSFSRILFPRTVIACRMLV